MYLSSGNSNLNILRFRIMYVRQQVRLHRTLRQKPPARFLPLFFSFVLVLAQIFPATIAQATESSLMWVEVCNSAGVNLVQVDRNGEEQRNECRRCPLCIIAGQKIHAIHAATTTALCSVEFTTVSYMSAQTTGTAGTGQFLLACRGPPTAETASHTALLSAQPRTRMILTAPWRAPWS